MIGLLRKINESNVVLDLVDGKLKLFTSTGKIDDALLQEIKENKELLISYLQSHAHLSVKDQAPSFIPKAQPARSYPASSRQRRLWVLSQFEDASLAYNMSVAYEIRGAFSLRAFENAFADLANRHEVLHSVFQENHEHVIEQRIAPVPDPGIAYHDLSSGSDEELQQHIRAEITKTFDVSEGPLYRLSLIRRSEEKHVLVLVIHHIICDGWSMEVLIRDLLSLYVSHHNGTASPLTPLRIQYKDYAVWEHEQMQRADFKSHEAYWLQQFSGELPVLSLKGDYPRPTVKSYHGGVVKLAVPAETVSRMRSFVRSEGGTLFMGLLAATNALFYRYTGQTDQVIGSPIAGRDHLDLEDQVGFYVNTLALRTRFKAGNSFRELFGIVKALTLGAYAHQMYPFDELVDKLELTKDISRSALFDVMLTLRSNNFSDTVAEKLPGDTEIVLSEGDKQSSKFDFTFEFTESGNDLQFNIEYNTDIYKPETVEKAGHHLIQLIEAALAEPDKQLYKLPYLTQEETAQLLDGFNDTRFPYPDTKTIAALFEEQAEQCPDKTALVFEEKEYTYASLNALANRFSRYLQQECGVQAHDLVGILLGRSDRLILSVLSILKSDAVYVPMDPHAPEARIAYMKQDGRMNLVIDEALISRFLQSPQHYSSENKGQLISSEAPAYVLYTSGSTGQPKGVVVSHKNVIRLVKADNYARLKGDEVILSTGAISFDATTFEYWGALLNGGTLVLCSQEQLLDPVLLAKEIDKRQVNTMWFTTGWLNQLVDTHLPVFAKLRLLLTGGDVLSPGHIQKLKQEYPALRVINGYGPTENTTFSACYCIEEVTPSIPIGRPVSNSSVYVFDDHMQVVPVGIIGELFLGGDGVAIGYLNSPEVTEEAFIANPYRAHERLYKSGDMGRWLPDGTIEFFGRKDGQVKIRGYRVELGEIKSTLEHIPGIKEALVLYAPVNGKDKQLIAYVVTGQELQASDIKACLGASLPSYMHPDSYIRLKEFPLTANGKIDYNSLPGPSGDSIPAGAEHMDPINKTEEEIQQIVATLLAKDKISVQDNFFDMGINSIKMIHLNKQLNQHFGRADQVVTLFRYPSIRRMAEYMTASVPADILDEEKIDDAMSIFQNTILDFNKLQNE